jgi:amidohydrolase
MPGLMATYRDLHANPELSFQEHRSAKIMADAARKAGFTVTEGVGKTGVVAVLKNGPGPVVLIRADMDGLPVIEQTGLPYASKIRGTSTAGVESGVMHACGHDTHMTAWIETARLLASSKDYWSGTLVMIGQPAEEIGLGALEMLKDGLYTRFPKPQYVLSFHDSADLASGTIGVTPGYALANVDSVDIKIRGEGGHGAYPHLTKDPIVIGSAIVMRLQTLVSREKSPFEPAVVTVGSFHSGAKHNIISDEATLQLTVRSYSDESRAHLLGGIRRVAKAEAEAAGVAPDRLPIVTVQETYTRATWNTPDFSREFADFYTSISIMGVGGRPALRQGFDRPKKTSRPPFAGESQANRRYGLYFAQKADVEGLQRCCRRVPLDRGRRNRPRPRPSRIPRRMRRSGHWRADRRYRAETSRRRSRAKPTNTPTCIRAWPRPRATKVSTKSPTGSKRWPRLKRATPASSRRRSTRFLLTRDVIRTARSGANSSAGPFGLSVL